jgi:hypothetical protein
MNSPPTDPKRSRDVSIFLHYFRSGTNVIICEIFSQKKWAILTKIKVACAENDHNIAFQEKIARKSVKIAENRDLDIDPRP